MQSESRSSRARGLKRAEFALIQTAFGVALFASAWIETLKAGKRH